MVTPIQTPPAMRPVNPVNIDSLISTLNNLILATNAGAKSITEAIDSIAFPPLGTPHFKVSLSANQSLTTGVAATIVFDTVIFDPSSYFNTSTGVWTPLVAGTYIVAANIGVNAGFTAGSGNYFINFIQGSSGISIVQGSAAVTSTDTYFVSGTTMAVLNGTTDSLSMQVRVTGTSPVVLGNSNLQTTFIGFRIA